MARFMRLDVTNAIVDSGLVPLFFNAQIDTAIEITAALSRGGARVVEYTNRGEEAYQVFTELARHVAKNDPGLILGVGSVVDAPTAAMYLAAGANFIVGPNHNPEITRLCNRRKVLYMPGCATESEIANAEELGVEICKVFPGDTLGGPAFLKALLQPCPWHRLMPSSGVDATEESVAGWIKAGAAAVGMGGKLVVPAAVKSGQFDQISATVTRVMGWVKQARGVPLFLGVEHVGLYPCGEATGEAVAQWYCDTFGFQSTEGAVSYFVAGKGAGRVEALKQAEGHVAHVAVRVSNFDAAVAALQAKGIGMGTPNVTPAGKTVYLAQPDPAGNPVHLVWTLR